MWPAALSWASILTLPHLIEYYPHVAERHRRTESAWSA
jgi:hypothetical protein